MHVNKSQINHFIDSILNKTKLYIITWHIHTGLLAVTLVAVILLHWKNSSWCYPVGIRHKSVQSCRDRISQRVSVVLGICSVGSHEWSCGWGQHHWGEAAVLVQWVPGQCGHSGRQRRVVLQAVWMNVGGCSHRALLCSWVVSGIWWCSIGLQLRVMHKMRGHICLTSMSQGILYCPLQLHSPVLEPVSDLQRKTSSISKRC